MGQHNSSQINCSKSFGLSELPIDQSEIQFTINDTAYTVPNTISAGTTLNTYIRNHAHLKGTKAMCHEGGCGACIVLAEKSGKKIAVNSCLVPVVICNGWKITTVEGVGGRKIGYHTLQVALANMNGSQCGYCSPGMIMNMFSAIQEGKLTMAEIENSFGGNICRCTGYRPILEAFKSFASDANVTMKKQLRDIEDLYNLKSACQRCPRNRCNGICHDLEIIGLNESKKFDVKFPNSEYYKVGTIEDIFEIFSKNPDKTCILYGGNTAHGVYRQILPQMLIDINDVPDMTRVEKDNTSLIFGGNVTLTTFKNTCETYAKDPGFHHLKAIADHVDLVASVPIRNIGTIAGNLMIKHQHPEFPSDIFLILETAGAQIHILESPTAKISTTLLNFFNTDMKHKLIYSIVIPSLDKETTFKSYKIMPRSQNAHAAVNMGFLFKFDSNFKVLEKPNIIIGGIQPKFFHATETENFLNGKLALDNNVLKEALKTLEKEIIPDHVLPDHKPEYRKLLSLGLLYKFVLSLDPQKVNSKFRSGGDILQRGLSNAKQDYDTDRNSWPINQPLAKLESLYQTSGEAEYINDIPIRDNEIFCAMTIADEIGLIEKIEDGEALAMEGVIAFFTAKDIPGKNTFINSGIKHPFMGFDEQLFADKATIYAGQPYGVIAAKTQEIALQAAAKVKVIFNNGPRPKPILTIRDVIASNDKTRVMTTMQLPAKDSPGKNVSKKINGTFECGSQYHFTMETQSCVCVPIEDGMDVFSATQWMDLTQGNISSVLNVPFNSINLQVRRLGGSYGSKISRSVQVACACALVSHKLNVPARLVMSIEDNMRSLGKRIGVLCEYDLGVDDSGKIQYQNVTYWNNVGCSFNESVGLTSSFHYYNCYDPSTWSLTNNDAMTDLPANTWCRAPGSTEAVGAIESVMERIAKATGRNSLDVRIANMKESDKEMLVPIIEDLKKFSEYESRVKEIDAYNTDNRWRKRGIAFALMSYPLHLFGQFHALVSIYARDGTVSIAHGGIEMGQGLHTKIIQIAAFTLGVDITMVKVKPTNSMTAPNDLVTGGSVGSDVCGYAVMMACKELLKRLEPIKQALKNPSWQELVLTAHAKNIDLCASYMYIVNEEIKTYTIYGATVAEVEVDILTGQHIIRRVDILEDVGKSLNPQIDLGQIEGSFVMGVGYWTSEELFYDEGTGSLINYRTWNYKVPGAKDIPEDFRVYFQRNVSNPFGIARSKSTSEPPMCMSCSVPIAIRNALNSARKDAGGSDDWYDLNGPVTMEKILLTSLTNAEMMTL